MKKGCPSKLTVLNEERTISNWIGTINPDTKCVGIYLFLTKGHRFELRYMLCIYGKFTNCSAGNCILIMLQMTNASLAAAFGKWKALGRTINKGIAMMYDDLNAHT